MDEEKVNGPLVFTDETSHKILQGELPLLTFMVDGNCVGQLWAKDGVLDFQGNINNSAKLFFDEVVRSQNRVIADKLLEEAVRRYTKLFKEV